MAQSEPVLFFQMVIKRRKIIMPSSEMSRVYIS